MEPIHILFTISGIITLIAFILYVRDILKPRIKIESIEDVIEDLKDTYGREMNRMSFDTFKLFISNYNLDVHYWKKLGLTEPEDQVHLLVKIYGHVMANSKTRIARAENLTFMAFAQSKLYKPKNYFDFSMPGDNEAKCPKCGQYDTYCALKLTVPDEDLDQFSEYYIDNNTEELAKIYRKYDPERLLGACRQCEIEFDHIYKPVKI